ncbi:MULTISPECIES: hypothetical protein [unclassified Arthrobacter]|uniref:hypothetical protein n=1 Tax=unclassified Arthrobacter TaxID=235627 RepID=UPI002DFD7F32|nr:MULTISPECIES: hypothetical protein [unclassified Arthrobacter]MEC5193492.1 hypothetical protein [Arthrobacter sp. MP_M4]MEC5204958.1 hypothetical protein [Arthrobacter sp. MP_M7]
MSVNKPANGLDRNAYLAKKRAELIESALWVKKFLEHKGRLPYGYEPEYAKLAYYRKLWDQNVPVPNEVRAVLDVADMLPQPRHQAHARRLAEYRQFIAENRRFPSTLRTPWEKSLAAWAYKMKKDGSNADIREALLVLIEETKAQRFDF